MELFKKIANVNTVCGNEESLHPFITKELEKYADEIYTDNLANLIVHKKANGKKLMICVNCDENGFMSTYVDENGYVRFSTIGNIMLSASLYQKIIFDNGTKGVICSETAGSSGDNLKISSMYIDIGSKSKDDTQKLISPGDTASYICSFDHSGSDFIAKSIGNKACIYAIIRAFQKISLSPYDLYFVFSSQGVIGNKGAKTASYNIEPDACIFLDVINSCDTPGTDGHLSLGGGPVIKIMDKTFIAHKDVRSGITKCANKNCINIQNHISSDSSFLNVVQTSARGLKCGVVSLPVRHLNTPCETINSDDVKSCINLISELCKIDYFF